MKTFIMHVFSVCFIVNSCYYAMEYAEILRVLVGSIIMYIDLSRRSFLEGAGYTNVLLGSIGAKKRKNGKNSTS